MTDTVHNTLAEREAVHGKFSTHAQIAQNLKECMFEAAGWARLDAAQREALEMVQHKVARILNGNPNYRDHWLDVAGYSMLVHDRLEAEQ